MGVSHSSVSSVFPEMGDSVTARSRLESAGVMIGDTLMTSQVVFGNALAEIICFLKLFKVCLGS